MVLPHGESGTKVRWFVLGLLTAFILCTVWYNWGAMSQVRNTGTVSASDLWRKTNASAPEPLSPPTTVRSPSNAPATKAVAPATSKVTATTTTTPSSTVPPTTPSPPPPPIETPPPPPRHMLKCGETLIPSPHDRNRLWLCPLRRNFTKNEETLLNEFITDGTLVPSVQSTGIGSEPNRTMRALYDGLWVPAPEPLLKPVGEKEIDLITKEAKCLHRNFADNDDDALNLRVEACMIVRNRVKLVVEWIQYHRILGVEFFHIFDDHSHDGLQEALAPFVKKGIVKLEQVPPPPVKFLGVDAIPPARQMGAMSACIEYARERQAKEPSKGHIWQLMTDPDEFLLYDGCAGDLIRSVMKQVGDSAKVGAVAIARIWQGHVGEHRDTFRTQFERIQYELGHLDHHFKSLIRADLVEPFGPGKPVPMTPHGFNFQPPADTFYQSGEPSGRILLKPAPKYYRKGDGLLAHFHTRSLASFVQRFIDGRSGHTERPAESMTLDEIAAAWHHVKFYNSPPPDAPKPCGVVWSKFRELQLLLLRGLGHHDIDEEEVKKLPSTAANETSTLAASTLAAWTTEAVQRKEWPSFVERR